MGRPRTTDVQKIVEAAAKVFERHGYADASLDLIASEAGVSKPTIYQYVGSKPRLLEIIVESVIFPLRDGVDQILASSVPAAEKIDQYLRLHVTAAIRYKVYYQVILGNRQLLSAEGARRYQAWAREVNHAAVALLEQGVAEGVVRSDIDLVAASNLLNSMLTSIAQWHHSELRLGPDDIHDQTRRFVAGFVDFRPDR